MKKELKSKLYLIAALLLTGVCVFFGGRAVIGYWQLNAQKVALLDLAQQVKKIEAENENADLSENGVSPMAAACSALYQENQDFAAWLSIPETEVDYPTMYAPDRKNHYLYRNFEGEYSVCGLPFFDEGCNPTGDGNLLIYGHDMKDGSMFGSLRNYYDQAFFEEHQAIELNSISQSSEYQIVYVVQANALSTGFAYEKALTIQDEAAFDEFKSGCEANSLYSTGNLVEYSDKLLLLVTCSDLEKEGRLVIVAKRK